MMIYSAELQDYEATIRSIPRISPEEETMLLERIRLAHEGHIPSHLGIQAKHRLIEGYLGLVVFLVKCHKQHLKTLDVLDFVQEGNLALAKAVEHCHTFKQGKLSAYLAGAIRNALRRARTLDAPIHIPDGSLYGLCKKGKINTINAMQPCSLDAPFISHRGQISRQSGNWGEVLAAPTTDVSSAANRLAEKVECLLTPLTERQRQVLCMRYGLDPRDGRMRTREEVGCELGVKWTAVLIVERQAFRKIRRQAQAS